MPSFIQCFEAFSFCHPPYSGCWSCMSHHFLPRTPFTDVLGSCMCFSVLQHFSRFLSHLPGLCAIIRAYNDVMPLSKLFRRIALSLWWCYGSAHTSSSLSSSIEQHCPPFKVRYGCVLFFDPWNVSRRGTCPMLQGVFKSHCLIDIPNFLS